MWATDESQLPRTSRQVIESELTIEAYSLKVKLFHTQGNLMKKEALPQFIAKPASKTGEPTLRDSITRSSHFFEFKLCERFELLALLRNATPGRVFLLKLVFCMFFCHLFFIF